MSLDMNLWIKSSEESLDSEISPEKGWGKILYLDALEIRIDQ